MIITEDIFIFHVEKPFRTFPVETLDLTRFVFQQVICSSRTDLNYMLSYLCLRFKGKMGLGLVYLVLVFVYFAVEGNNHKILLVNHIML